MWTFPRQELVKGRALRFDLTCAGSPVSYAEVLQAWQHAADFRSAFLRLLADCPFATFRWETPGLTRDNAHQPFEFVLLNSPELAAKPDAHAFADHFRGTAANGVVEFANLGKDARLIVPCPSGEDAAYGHLGAFVRQAPTAQQHALFQAVGAAVQRRLGPKPVWLSTAGAGIAWLHVRLDERPKYYGHAPYRELAQSAC